MAEKINATCSICGKGYHKCANCKSGVKAAPWKQYTDTSDHYKVFQVIRGYNTGVYTRSETKEKLKAIDLSDIDDFRDNIKKIIKEILKEDKKAVVVDASEKVVSAPEDDAVAEESVVSEEQNVFRKKRYPKQQEQDA